MTHTSSAVSLSVPLPLGFWTKEARRLVADNAQAVGFPRMEGQDGYRDPEDIRRSIDYARFRISMLQGCGYRSET